jgi:hypothetical protein
MCQVLSHQSLSGRLPLLHHVWHVVQEDTRDQERIKNSVCVWRVSERGMVPRSSFRRNSGNNATLTIFVFLFFLSSLAENAKARVLPFTLVSHQRRSNGPRPSVRPQDHPTLDQRCAFPESSFSSFVFIQPTKLTCPDQQHHYRHCSSSSSSSSSSRRPLCVAILRCPRMRNTCYNCYEPDKASGGWLGKGRWERHALSRPIREVETTVYRRHSSLDWCRQAREACKSSARVKKDFGSSACRHCRPSCS